MNKINVVIAESNPLLLSGLKGYLGNYSGLYNIMNLHNNINGMMEYCVENEEIDILLLGEFSDVANSIELIRWVKSEEIPAKKIAYFNKLPYFSGKGILDAGADGVVWKSCSPFNLNKAINAVFAGESYNIDDLYKSDCEIRLPASQNHLTKREREIIQLIAECRTNKEIARKLDLSNKTIEAHRLNIMKKLDVHSGVELLKTALKMGFCSI